MPPGPGYNWICVLSGAAEIVGHVARYRAFQLAHLARDGRPVQRVTLENEWNDLKSKIGTAEERLEAKDVQEPSRDTAGLPPMKAPAEATPNPMSESHTNFSTGETLSSPQVAPFVPPASTPQLRTEVSALLDMVEPAATVDHTTTTEPSIDRGFVVSQVGPAASVHKNTLQSSKVPSSKLGRLFHYGGMFY